MTVNEKLFLSLETAFVYRNSPWSLELLQGDEISPSSYLGSWFHYIASFVPDRHQKALQGACQRLMDRALKLDICGEKEVILLDKIKAVVHRSKNFLLGDLGISGSNPLQADVSEHFVEKEGLIQPIKESGRYVNYLGEKVWAQFFETLRLLFPGMFSQTTNLSSYEPLLEKWRPLSKSDSLQVTWLGHASLLLQLAGFNLLFDPAFDDIGFLFKRHIPPGIALEKLPLLDFIGVSHNHDDHCQSRAVSFLADMQPLAMVPNGFGGFFAERGYEKIKEASWWEQVTLTKDGKEVTITSIPAEHGSQRSIGDLNQSLWQGFVVQSKEVSIYIAGDTALKEGLFEQIYDVFGSVDIAVLPIAPERELGVHLNCEQSLIAFDRLKANAMLPYHFAGYRQASEQIEDPYFRLERLLNQPKYEHLKSQVLHPRIGERFGINHDHQLAKESI